MTDPFGRDWDFVVDVTGDGFTVSILDRNGDIGANITSSLSVATIRLTDVAWAGSADVIAGVSLLDYTCTPAFSLACGRGNKISIGFLQFTDDSIFLGIDALQHGAVYTFGIASGTVSAPGGFVIVLLAIAGLAARRSSRR